jgi:hypothetical protein
MLRNQVGISNDLASLLYSRSSAEIITSRTLLSVDNNFTDAGQLVRCHDNEVNFSIINASMHQCNVIFYGRLKKNIVFIGR